MSEKKYYDDVSAYILCIFKLCIPLLGLFFFLHFLSFLTTASKLTLFKLLRLITAQLQICGVKRNSLHAQLSQITAIVQLCYSIGQLQLSEYTCW